jgi:hypothetical protein
MPPSVMAEKMRSLLPQPTYGPVVSDDEDDVQQFAAAPSLSLISRTAVPPYGQRPGWKPASAEDFGMLMEVMGFIDGAHSLQETVAPIRNVMLHSIR